MDIERDNEIKLKAFSTTQTLDPSYLAGFIDGDGCIYIRKQKAIKEGTNDYFQAGIEISQSRTNILQIIALHYGGKLYSEKRAKTHRTEYTLRMAGKSANMLLNDIKEHLVIKHKQATLVEKINRYNNKHNLFDKKLELYEKCSSLNKEKTADIKLERVNEAYIAGLFDAEGYCSIRISNKTKNYKGIKIKITQTSYPEVLSKIKDIITFGRVVKESDGNSYWLLENSANATKFFTVVKPHIIVKLNQVDILTSYIKSKPSDRELRKRLVQALNTEKHESETLPKDFKLLNQIYSQKKIKEKIKAKKIKDELHKEKVKKQYAEKSENMKGEKNWNYGKELSLEHSYKISNSKLKISQTFEEYKEKRKERDIENKIKSTLSVKEKIQRGIDKNRIGKRKATAEEVIKILKLSCEGNTDTDILEILKKDKPDTTVTINSIKNVKCLKTCVCTIEPEYEEYSKMKKYYLLNKEENVDKKNKVQENKKFHKKEKNHTRYYIRDIEDV